MSILERIFGKSTEPCDHDWEKERHYTGRKDLYYGEDGEPYIIREEVLNKRCVNCGECEPIDKTRRALFLDVERTEVIGGRISV